MLVRLVTSAPRRLLIAAVLLTAVLGAVAAGTIDALALNRYEAPGSESVAARDALADEFGTGSPNVALLVTATSGSVDDPDVSAAGRRLTDELAAEAAVGDAWSYWSEDAPSTLAATDGRHALVLAWVPGDADHVRRDVLPGLEERFAGAEGPIEVTLGGGDQVFRDVAEQARADFLRAEVVIVPLIALLLWAVYRRLSLALVTLGVGIFSAVGALAILRAVTSFTEVSTFASNIALIMGIGLGVDYGLFITYRFREELANGVSVPEAVRRAVSKAGRTVAFSAATVAAALAVLFVFPYPFLTSFAYAGIAVVMTAVIGSIVILPASLMLLGHRATRRSPTGGAGSRFWHRTTAAVMRRPVVTGAAALAAVLALAAPALTTSFGAPDDRILASEQPVRQMYDTIRADFTTEDADMIQVVAPRATTADVGPYAAELSGLPGVERVDSVAGAYRSGQRVGPPGPVDAERFTSADGTWLAVVPTGDRLAGDPSGLVADVRDAPAPFEVFVGGYPADLADYRDGVVERLPLVAVLVLAATFIVLFLMTGSVVAPLKASILNLLSLAVMGGVLAWGFQEGGLSDLLGFVPTGQIEPSIPLLMFCVAYGLSMDYEVFLLSRIKDDYDKTGDVVGSVPRGIARSAGLVSAAALVLAVSFAVYTTSEVVILQQLGVGMAVTVIVDATVIRGVLVPAFMRLAGRANWWAPGPLRRLHARVGLRENDDDAPAHPYSVAQRT